LVIFALLLPLSRDQNRGGERTASAALAGGPGEGKREREVRRLDSRPQLRRRQIEASWPRGPAPTALWWQHCGLGRRASGGG